MSIRTLLILASLEHYGATLVAAWATVGFLAYFDPIFVGVYVLCAIGGTLTLAIHLVLASLFR